MTILAVGQITSGCNSYKIRDMCGETKQTAQEEFPAFTARLHMDLAMMRLNTIMEFPAEEFQGKKSISQLICVVLLCCVQ
jgi:hypothetical protein